MFLMLWTVPLLMPVYSFTDPFEVEVDGKNMSFADTQPYIDKQTGSTMVPARELAERLGAEVKWDSLTERVSFRNERFTAVLTIGEPGASVNGKPVKLDAPAVIQNGQTVVPLRFVGESLGADVGWAEERQTALVTSPGKAQRATWIWDSSMIKGDRDGLLRFAAEQKLASIYIRFDTYTADREAYRAFIRGATELGIKVEALAGASDWIYENNHTYLRRYIDAVTQYNLLADAGERFQGYHFDIEPYTLGVWKTDRTWVLERWMDTVRLIEKEVRNADPGMKMVFDIPFWLNSYPVPGTEYSFSAWLLEKADGVVIMAYRNTALGNNGIIARAKPIILEAATLKKAAVVAVDTLPSKEGDHTTFHAIHAADMEAELQAVTGGLVTYPSYSGVAIHDYARWIELLK
jgi:hypothetical protein